DELAAMRRHLELAPEERLRGGRAKADDRARLDQFNLGVQPRPACGDLAGVRLLVNPALAARLPFEMLDDVRHVHALAIDAGVFERLVEQAAGRTDERASCEILGVTRLFADEH